MAIESDLPPGSVADRDVVAATALVFLVTAALLGLTCPPAEELEDWSIHYHRRRVQEANGE